MKNYKMKFELKLFVVSSMLFFNGLIASAQEYSVIKDVDVLEKEKTVLKEDYPHVFIEVEIRDVQKINDRQSKVFYQKGNQQYEAVVNSGREDLLLVATSRVINEKEMPNIVMDAFKNSKYNSWNIERTFEVTTPYTSVFYRIDVSKENIADEKKKFESLFYTHLGQYEKPPY